MSTAALAIVTENAVLALGIVAGWRLFRQGGGWQFKTPPPPKAPPVPKGDAGQAAPGAEVKNLPAREGRAS